MKNSLYLKKKKKSEAYILGVSKVILSMPISKYLWFSQSCSLYFYDSPSYSKTEATLHKQERVAGSHKTCLQQLAAGCECISGSAESCQPTLQRVVALWSFEAHYLRNPYHRVKSSPAPPIVNSPRQLFKLCTSDFSLVE